MSRAVFPLSVAAFIAAATLIAVPSNSSAKTVKACEEEWKANKASIQASGKRKKDFIAGCRAEAVAPAAQTAPAPQSPAPAAAQAAPAPAQTAPAAPEQQTTTAAPAQPQPQPAPFRARRTKTALNKAGQFASETEARSHCPSDTVVWANTRSHIYHFTGTADYGHTKTGAYMCEHETAAAGIRAAKNEHHP